MEKTNKSKNLFLKFLPKAASVVSFQNHPFSPGRDHHHKHKAQAHKGFSGPINFSALPDEARSKPKNGSFHAQEPTSPKVSCMGQIKLKHKHKKKKLIKAAKKAVNKSQPFISSDDDDKQRKKSNSTTIGRFFTRSSNKDHQSSVHGSKGRPGVPDHDDDNNKVIPSLGQMRRFASGRESLANFDWTAQIAPIDHDHDRDCYSDDERKRLDSDDDDDDGDEVIIPYSAPILMGGGLEPRKEVNIWKRRTMAPPTPLSLNSKVR